MVEFNYNSALEPTDVSDKAHEAVDPALILLSEPDRMTGLHVTTPRSTFPVGNPAK